MKYYTKEWQKRISDAPDNARALAERIRLRGLHGDLRGYRDRCSPNEEEKRKK